MQGMRDFFRSSLRRGLQDLNPEDRLMAAWPVACGSALAAHGELGELDAEGVLHVLVAQPEWQETFYGMRSALASDLSRIAGVRVSAIHFENKRPESKRPESRRAAPTQERGGPSMRRSSREGLR